LRKDALSFPCLASQVEQFVVAPPEKFVKFCTVFMQREATLTKDQEFNPDDPPVEVKDSEEIYVGHSTTFLFQNAVQFIVLRDFKSELKHFLKLLRVPHHMKFAARLLEIFHSLDS
jgi:hypothetical protein